MTATVQDRSRSLWLAFAVLCAVQLMVIIDTSIVNIALPSIQASLGFSQANLGWIANAYTIAFGSLLLLSGRLGDLVGRKNMFLAGLLVFTASSLLCGVAVNQPMMIIGRVLEGAGAAMAAAVVIGMIVAIFRDQGQQARAIAGFSFVAAAGGTVGILAGGLLTQEISWRWVFFINLPIGVAAILLTIPLVPADRGLGLRAGANPIGATLGRMLASRNVAGANGIQVLFVAGLFGFNFLGTLYLQRVERYSPLEASFAFLPLAAALAVISLGLTARLTLRFGPRRILLAGLVLVVAALGLAARAPLRATYLTDVLPVMTLLGAGAGLAMPSILGLAMSVPDPRDAGLASGLSSTAAMAGGALGLGVLNSLASWHTHDLLISGQSQQAARYGGLHLAFFVAALTVAGGLLIGVIVWWQEPKKIRSFSLKNLRPL